MKTQRTPICLNGRPSVSTDAHKGLPYYMTLLCAAHVLYSRVAPCGRPLVGKMYVVFLMCRFPWLNGIGNQGTRKGVSYFTQIY